MVKDRPLPPSATPPPQPPHATAPAISSRVIFGAARTVFIDHGGQRYTLRITRENKLILTK